MNSIYFQPEHHQFRKKIREFLHTEVAPNIDRYETERLVPRSVWARMGQLGFLGLHYPKIWGGFEKDFFYSVILLEELGRIGSTGFRTAIAVHAYMATAYLAFAGSEALNQLYLIPAILGNKISALAITEPHAGSDLSQIQMTAIRDGDFYIINGCKQFVANGTQADFVVIAAKTDLFQHSPKGATGISLFIIDTHLDNITTKPLNMLGWHSADIAELTFHNTQIPVTRLIGTENKGFSYMMICLQLERLVAGILALGGIDHCLDITRSYLMKRQAFNKSLSNLTVLRHRIAEFTTELITTRQLGYHAAWLYQQKEWAVAECSMLKLKATELAKQVAQECIQFHGAHGNENNSHISRIYRDAQAATIAGGASEIMRDIIAYNIFSELRSYI